MGKPNKKSGKSMKNFDMTFIQKLIDKYELNKRIRDREIVYKRNFIMAMMYRHIQNYSVVGKHFGLKHCSVMHAVKNHNEWSSNKDKLYLQLINDIKAEYLLFSKHHFYTNKVNCNVVENDGDFIVMNIKFVAKDFFLEDGMIDKETFIKLFDNEYTEQKSA